MKFSKDDVPYVHVHIEKAHVVDLSFRDTAILVKNGQKNLKSGFYRFVYWEAGMSNVSTIIYNEFLTDYR